MRLLFTAFWVRIQDGGGEVHMTGTAECKQLRLVFDFAVYVRGILRMKWRTNKLGEQWSSGTHLPPIIHPRWSPDARFLIQHSTATTVIIPETVLFHNVTARSTPDCTDVSVNEASTTKHMCSHQPDPARKQ